MSKMFLKIPVPVYKKFAFDEIDFSSCGVKDES